MIRIMFSVGIIKWMFNLQSPLAPRSPSLGCLPFPENHLSNARWAQEEFGDIPLGDARCSRRFVRSFTQMLNFPGQSIAHGADSVAAAKAFYRLLDADTLTEALIFDTHRGRVYQRASASGTDVFLALQDTTTLNFTTHRSLKGLGGIGKISANSTLGFHAHATLLTAAEQDEVFGLLGVKIYCRETHKRQEQSAGTRNREAISQKESVRWLESFTLAQDAAAVLGSRRAADPSAAGGAALIPLVVSVGDREADIYELLLEAQQHREQGMGLLVRSQHNRGLEAAEGLLWDQLAQCLPEGVISLKLPRSQGKSARTVALTVRVLTCELAVPVHKRKYLGLTESVPITVIELVEEGVEKGLHWRLLTTLPVEGLVGAAKLARWYAKRWQIEEYHRILKTGCRVEARQLRTQERLRPVMAMDMIVASTLMGMSAAAREQPESPAAEWLDPDELGALDAYSRQGKPLAAGASPVVWGIGPAVRLIGKMGGHLGRKGDGHPGSEVLWRGLIKLQAVTEAWRMFSSNTHDTCG